MEEKFEATRLKLADDLKRLLANAEISPFEREKLGLALEKLESGIFIPNLIRSLQASFYKPAMKGRLTDEVLDFYHSLPKSLPMLQILGFSMTGKAYPL
ncbi:bacteriocin immunity protein [Lactococcus termiticola]|uniref:Uncharacterized protein n=1 Tax=Lactococcus termiticola TaxID=2169526 RepID=A0A2R5HFV3_9LACT|nr:bacteriocin immunity protein [Lactococcus termiticola]GBG96894.1 hypothetical protein NtB2_01029 [Lactococcus termiticola]